MRQILLALLALVAAAAGCGGAVEGAAEQDAGSDCGIHETLTYPVYCLYDDAGRVTACYLADGGAL